MSNETSQSKISFVYFGTSYFATIVLDQLASHNLLPTLIVATPDQPQGRKLIMTPPPVKVWAEEHNIPCIQPTSLKTETIVEELKSYSSDGWDVFIVASYGKIIPQAVLDIPSSGTLNVHPSLLPKFRGPSPIQSAILSNEQHTGVTIMQLDALMDHGPIIAQRAETIEPWPPTTKELKEKLGTKGGDMLAKLLPDWIAGKITPQEQDHEAATFTKKIEKADGLLDLSADPYQNFLKIQAFAEWPKTYFFIEKNGKQMRIVISEAYFNKENNTLELVRVIPEGKNEMSYSDFKKGYL